MSQDAPSDHYPAAQATDAGGGEVDWGLQFEPGSVLGDRYQIRALLGCGGRGEVWHAYDLNLLLDIFNVFNRQGEIVRDNAYTDFYEDPVYQPLDWVTGVPYEPIEPGDIDRPPTSPTWNAPVFWQDPRTIRLGVRLSF